MKSEKFRELNYVLVRDIGYIFRREKIASVIVKKTILQNYVNGWITVKEDGKSDMFINPFYMIAKSYY